MTKEELFEKYSINESHATWDNLIDNWISVELYRIMHDGNLPPSGDMSVDYITDYLDKVLDDIEFAKKMMARKDFGSLFLTAKRMVCSLWEPILKYHNDK